LPVRVVSNIAAPGAYMAYENFTEDTVVDVSPYTPWNWKPMYGKEILPVTGDTTGFVLKLDDEDTCLVYRHKAGVSYPVSCLLAPATNLAWRDYRFTGTIIKPDQPAFDTAEVGIAVYDNGQDRYAITFKNDGDVRISGGRWSNDSLNHVFFGAGDTLRFDIAVTTNEVNDEDDKEVRIRGKAKVNEIEKTIIDLPDTTSSRIIYGYPGIRINYYGISSSTLYTLNPLKISEAAIQKEEDE
jgi:hypothetical protein